MEAMEFLESSSSFRAFARQRRFRKWQGQLVKGNGESVRTAADAAAIMLVRFSWVSPSPQSTEPPAAEVTLVRGILLDIGGIPLFGGVGKMVARAFQLTFLFL